MDRQAWKRRGRDWRVWAVVVLGIIALACGPGGKGGDGGGKCQWKRALGPPGTVLVAAQVAQVAGGAPAVAPEKPRPPKPPKPRIRNCGKNDSSVWKGFKPVRGKRYRDNGKTGKDRRFYDWDNTHNDIEVYGHDRKHLGSMDPQTGQMYKPAEPGRKLDE